MKLFVTSILLFCCMASVSAQESHHIELGLTTGINMTSLHGEGFTRYYDWHYSATGALQVKYNLNEKFSLLTAVAYESKGSKGTNLKLIDQNGTSLGSNYDFSFTYTYITVPVLFRYTHGGFPFYVNAGPYFGSMLSYMEAYKDTEFDRTSDMKNLDLGFSAGVGLFYPISDRWTFTGEIRNNLGLVNVWSSNSTYQNQPFRPILNHNPVYTNSTNFVVGIHYKL